MISPERIKAYFDAIDGDEKFIMTMGAGIVDAILLAWGLIDQGTYAMLTGSTVGVFIAGVAYENTRKPTSA